MKVKLNFQADKPSLNGRIYTKYNIKKSFDEKFFNGDVFVLDSYGNNGKIDLSKVIGIAKKYEINSKSEIIIDMKLLKTSLSKIFEGKEFKITSSGYGHVDEETGIIKDFKLSHFFIPKEIK